MNLSDTRVRNTRQSIRQVFLSLLRERPAGKISVTELCAICEINRATFYHHYADVFNLLDALEQDVLDELAGIFQPQPGRTMREIFLNVLYALRDAGPDWWVLGSENGDPALYTKMFMAVYEANFPRMQQRAAALPPQTQALLYRYLAQGSGGVIRQWIKSGDGQTPEELADFLVQATNLLMNGFVKKPFVTQT